MGTTSSKPSKKRSVRKSHCSKIKTKKKCKRSVGCVYSSGTKRKYCRRGWNVHRRKKSINATKSRKKRGGSS